jgi:hypothetical protein
MQNKQNWRTMSLLLVLALVLAVLPHPGFAADSAPDPWALFMLDGWRWHAKATAQEAGTDWHGTAVDDAAWARTDASGVATILKEPGPPVVLRRHFVVPRSWSGREAYVLVDWRLGGALAGAVHLNGTPLPPEVTAAYAEAVKLFVTRKEAVDRITAKLRKHPDNRRLRHNLAGAQKSLAEAEQKLRDARDSSEARPKGLREVSQLLRPGEDNVVAFELGHGLNKNGWKFADSMVGIILFSPRAEQRVVVLVAPNLGRDLCSAVKSWIREAKRHTRLKAIVLQRDFGSAAEVRRFVKALHREHDITGLVLIGDIPYARDLGDRTCVAYFADVDGHYSDKNDDGVVEAMREGPHAGPELWVSWLPGGPERNSADLIAFSKRAVRYYRRELAWPQEHYFLRRAGPDKAQLFRDLYDGDSFLLGEGNVLSGGFGRSGRAYLDVLRHGCEFMTMAAHGGKGFFCGPHKKTEAQALQSVYPGPLVVWVNGCNAGKFFPDRPARVGSAGDYLRGPGNTQVSLSYSGTIADTVSNYASGWLFQLLDACPTLAEALYILQMGEKWIWWQNKVVVLGNPLINPIRHPEFRGTGGAVEGTISSDAADLPLGPCIVEAWRNRVRYGRVRTEEDGRYRLGYLPAGDYDLTVWLNPIEKKARSVRVEWGKSTRVDVELRPRWCVSGRVTDQDGKLVPQCWLLLRKDGMQEPPDEDYAVPVDANGRFRIAGETPGRYKLSAHSVMQKQRCYPAEFSLAPKEGDQINAPDLVLKHQEPWIITGRIVDSANQPLADIPMRVVRFRQHGEGRNWPFPDTEGLTPSARIAYLVGKRGGAEMTMDIASSDVGEYEITLTQPGFYVLVPVVEFGAISPPWADLRLSPRRLSLKQSFTVSGGGR